VHIVPSAEVRREPGSALVSSLGERIYSGPDAETCLNVSRARRIILMDVIDAWKEEQGMIEGAPVAGKGRDRRKDGMMSKESAPGKAVPSTAPLRQAGPRTRFTAVAFVAAAVPAALIVGQTVRCKLMPAAGHAPLPPPALRARFDALLATAPPDDTRLPPPVFSRTTLSTRRPGHRDEPVWIADAHAEGAWGVRIVLNADTAAVKAFSSEVWAAHPPDRTGPPQIRTASDARSAARRFFHWLGKRAVEDAGWQITEPDVMRPRPWGTWLVSAHRGDRLLRVALDAQTGNLLDFREEVTPTRSNP